MAGNKKLTGKRRKEAYQMLHDVCKLLDNHNIPYVLEAGTLLGIIRENRLLPWDNDVDLTISAVDAEKLKQIKHLFWKMGYRSKLRNHKWDAGPIQKGKPRILKIQTRQYFFFKKDSLLDIFIKYKVGNEYLWTVDDKHPVLKRCPAFFYDQKVIFPFDGGLFTVPEKYEEYLAYHYGKNWKTPIREWNFRLDDSCEKEEIKLPVKKESLFNCLRQK